MQGVPVTTDEIDGGKRRARPAAKANDGRRVSFADVAAELRGTDRGPVSGRR